MSINKMDVTQNLLPFKVTTFVMSLILCLDLFQTEKSLLVSKLHFAALHQICSNANTQFVAVALVAGSLQPHASTFIEIMHWPYFIEFMAIDSKSSNQSFVFLEAEQTKSVGLFLPQ